MPSTYPVSPPLTPRQSDISFTSVQTASSGPHRKHSPTPPIRVHHPSTSTISRDSRASADDRPAPPRDSSRKLLLESSSSTRLPKARVFLHRDHRPDRPKNHSSQSGALPSRTVTPKTLTKRTGVPPPHEKRCVSDLHDAYRAQRLRVQTSATPAPEPWGRRRVATHHEESVPLGNDQDLPTWIPNDELENWTPSPEHDPCVLENEPSSRWASSLRNLSNLYKVREKSPPSVRGSILEVHPPTLTERFGLGTLGDRRHAYRDLRGRTAGRGRMNNRSKAKHDEWKRSDSPTRVAYLKDDDDMQEMGRDDYVGFLIAAPEQRISRPRKGWLVRFLRRSKA